MMAQTAVQKLDNNHRHIVEAEFRDKDLTYETSQSILLYLESIIALDLSYNTIERFPQLLPPSLTALNLSHNAIANIQIAPGNLKNLVELNLSYNNLESVASFANVGGKLQFLDLSHNNLINVDGLEPFVELKVLKLQHNRISATIALRGLRIFKSLRELDLTANPVSDKSDLKYQIKNTLPGLKTLSGQPLRVRQAIQSKVINDDLYYSEMAARNSRCSSMASARTAGGGKFPRSALGHAPSQQHLQQEQEQPYMESHFNSQFFAALGVSEVPSGLYADGSPIDPLDDEVESLEDDSRLTSRDLQRSQLPWRKPPDVTPRPWVTKAAAAAPESSSTMSSAAAGSSRAGCAGGGGGGGAAESALDATIRSVYGEFGAAPGGAQARRKGTRLGWCSGVKSLKLGEEPPEGTSVGAGADMSMSARSQSLAQRQQQPKRKSGGGDAAAPLSVSVPPPTLETKHPQPALSPQFMAGAAAATAMMGGSGSSSAGSPKRRPASSHPSQPGALTVHTSCDWMSPKLANSRGHRGDQSMFPLEELHPPHPAESGGSPMTRPAPGSSPDKGRPPGGSSGSYAGQYEKEARRRQLSPHTLASAGRANFTQARMRKWEEQKRLHLSKSVGFNGSSNSSRRRSIGSPDSDEPSPPPPPPALPVEISRRSLDTVSTTRFSISELDAEAQQLQLQQQTENGRSRSASPYKKLLELREQLNHSLRELEQQQQRSAADGLPLLLSPELKKKLLREYSDIQTQIDHLDGGGSGGGAGRTPTRSPGPPPGSGSSGGDRGGSSSSSSAQRELDFTGAYNESGYDVLLELIKQRKGIVDRLSSTEHFADMKAQHLNSLEQVLRDHEQEEEERAGRAGTPQRAARFDVSEAAAAAALAASPPHTSAATTAASTDRSPEPPVHPFNRQPSPHNLYGRQLEANSFGGRAGPTFATPAFGVSPPRKEQQPHPQFDGSSNSSSSNSSSKYVDQGINTATTAQLLRNSYTSNYSNTSHIITTTSSTLRSSTERMIEASAAVRVQRSRSNSPQKPLQPAERSASSTVDDDDDDDDSAAGGDASWLLRTAVDVGSPGPAAATATAASASTVDAAASTLATAPATTASIAGTAPSTDREPREMQPGRPLSLLHPSESLPAAAAAAAAAAAPAATRPSAPESGATPAAGAPPTDPVQPIDTRSIRNNHSRTAAEALQHIQQRRADAMRLIDSARAVV